MPLVRLLLTYTLFCSLYCLCLLNIKFHSIAGCLALTVGCSDNAREIFEDSVTPLDESLARSTDVMKAPSVRSLEISSCILCFLLRSFYDL